MTDTVANRSIAVMRTRLPYTDRRSLSQAWFSALHLAQIVPARGLPARRADDHAFGAAGVRAVATATGHEAAPSRLPTSRSVKPARCEAEADVRPARASSGRARAASRDAFEAARSYPPFHTSLTVGAGGARIKLLVRREGPTLHVVALCSSASADLVRRALACADRYLRQNGESVRASVRTCSEDAL